MKQCKRQALVSRWQGCQTGAAAEDYSVAASESTPSAQTLAEGTCLHCQCFYLSCLEDPKSSDSPNALQADAQMSKKWYVGGWNILKNILYIF